MKHNLKKWLRPALFTLGGALAGLGYFYLVGCANGSCPISANPLTCGLHGAHWLALVRRFCRWMQSGVQAVTATHKKELGSSQRNCPIFAGIGAAWG